jgi:WD40 repeat protein
MTFWNRVRSRWASSVPLITFVILFTLPWVEVSCNYEFSDEFKRSANGATESGRADILSQFIRAHSGPQPPSFATTVLQAATTPAVATQSGLQATFGGYTVLSTWYAFSPPDSSPKPVLNSPGPAPLLILCALCVVVGLSAAASMRPGRPRGLAIAAAACAALALLFLHDFRGFRITGSLGPANARIVREFEEGRKARGSQFSHGDDAPFAGPPTLGLRYTVWYHGAFVVLMLSVLSGMAECRSSRKKELAGGISRTRLSDAAMAAAALGFLCLCLCGWTWRARVQVRADALARKARDADVAQVKAAREVEREARDAAKRSLMLRYLADMKKVKESWISDDVALFRKLLDAQLPTNQEGVDRREFEWYYWQRKLAWGHVTLNGHTDGIRCVAFSPIGSRIASASRDGTAIVWDATSGRAVQTIKGHAGSVSGVAFSPDGKWLATASSDRTVKVWDAATGTELHTLKGHAGPVWCVAFGPDGTRLASGSFDHTVKVWDTATGREILTFDAHPDQVTCVAFSPDGKWLASASRDGKVLIWDPNSGRATRSIESHAVVWSVALSPDGKSLASASAGRHGTVTMWTTESGRAGPTLSGHEGAVNGVAFAKDGQRLASAGQDGTIKIWNPTNGQERLTIVAHAAAINSVSWSPDGKRLASASWDGTVKVWDADPADENSVGHERNFDRSRFESGTGSRSRYTAEFEPGGAVKISDAATGRIISTLRGQHGRVIMAAFHPNDRRIATAAANGTVGLWDIATGSETLSLASGTSEIRSLAFSSDGQQLAAVGWNALVKVWDASPPEIASVARANRVVATFNVSMGGVSTEAARTVALSPDGQRLALTSADRKVRLVDARTGKPVEITLEGDSTSTYRLAFSADGKRLAAARATGETVDSATVTVWDAASGRRTQLLSTQPKPITSLAFSVDGSHFATACMDRSVRLWDAQSGKEMQTVTSDAQLVSYLVFRPDGKWLAVANADGTVTITDLGSGKVVKSLKTGRYFIAGVAFSPDCKQFASPALDGFKVWDTETWREAAYARPGKHKRGDQGEIVAFSSDGKRVVSAGSNVYVWDAETWQEVWMPPIDLFMPSLGSADSRPVLSNDGNQLAKILGNGTVRLWDLSPLAEPSDVVPAER